MKQCHRCGAPLEDDALFCTSCGTKFENQNQRKCQFCGAALDADSQFCTECGHQVGGSSTPPQQVAPQPTAPVVSPVNTVSTTTTSMESSYEQEIQVDEESKSKTTLIAIIAALTVLLCAVGGYLYYDNVYLPEKIDREAPRYYTMANAVVLRSSKSAGADYNKIGSLPYGTELITYEQDAEWSRVKTTSAIASGEQQTGYVASQFLLSKPDFFLLNSIFGDQESKENVFTTKCRLAVLNYFKSKGYIGKIDDQLRTEAGITTYPDSENQWQIFCKPKDAKPNNVFFKRLYDKNSRYTDFAVIIKNIVNGNRKLLYFYFDEDETPHFLTEQDAPDGVYINDILMLPTGEIYVRYSY